MLREGHGTGVYIECSAVERTFDDRIKMEQLHGPDQNYHNSLRPRGERPNQTVLGRANIRTAFSTVTAVTGSLLVKTKPVTKEHNRKFKGVIYRVPCQDCLIVYIGETGCKLDTRLTEHKRDLCGQRNPLLLNMLYISEDHPIAFRFWPRKIKEALLIRRHQNFNQDT